MTVYALAWLVVLAPALGFVASYLTESARRAAQICLLFSGLSLVVAVIVAGYRLGHNAPVPYESVITFWTMASSETGVFPSDFHTFVGVRVDALSSTFMVAVALVSVVVQTYSLVGLRRDAGYRRFSRTTALFTFAMLGLVSAPNLFDLLIMWSGVAVTVYALGSQSWQAATAAAPARRAFVSLRVADACLLLAIVFGFVKFGSHAFAQTPPSGADISDPFSFRVLGGSPPGSAQPGEWHLGATGLVQGVGPRTLIVLAILFLVASVIRSGQVPAHAWLLEAANTPLTALALIASLAAGSGVYLVARLYPLFMEATQVLTALALIGALGAVLAGMAAAVQRDAVRLAILVCVAQLGLVAATLGVGAFAYGLFALLVYVPLTAALFLLLENVVRVYQTRDLDVLGGAWARMRGTSLALIAWAAGVSVVGLGSYNCLAAAFRNTLPTGGHIARVPQAVVVVAAIAAIFLVALSSCRLVLSICRGKPVRGRAGARERQRDVEPLLRRSPAALLVITALAIPTGFPGFSAIALSRAVYYGTTPERLSTEPAALLLCVVLALAGAALARGAAGLLVTPALRRLLAGTAADAARVPLLDRVAGAVTLLVGRFVDRSDRTVTEPLLGGAGEAALALSAGSRAVESPRLRTNLLISVAASLVIALGSVLAVTGHFPFTSLSP